MAIKIQCGCGQKYAFEIEPISGQMPSAIACPSCGIDGTTAANAAIAQAHPQQPAVTTTASSLHLAASTPSAQPPSRRMTRLPGQVDAAQAEHEARAKVSWGDSPRDVIAYLMMQGFSAQDANEMVQEMYAERTATIRTNGIRKIVIGSVLICVPIVSLLGFLAMGYIPLKLFAVTVMVGLWGAWMVFKGSFMVAAPKMESGDVSEQ